MCICRKSNSISCDVLREQLMFPFHFLDRLGKHDVTCTVSGGGRSSQAGAIRLAMSRALCSFITEDEVEWMRQGMASLSFCEPWKVIKRQHFSFQLEFRQVWFAFHASSLFFPTPFKSSTCKSHGYMVKWSFAFAVWPLKVQWHPTPVLLPGKSHGRSSLVGCSPWGH